MSSLRKHHSRRNNAFHSRGVYITRIHFQDVGRATFHRPRRLAPVPKPMSLPQPPEEDEINTSFCALDKILAPSKSRFWRCMWILIIVLGTGLFLEQTWKTVISYREGEPAKKLIFEINDMFNFPIITFCPYRPTDTYDIIKMLKEEYVDEFNATMDKTRPVSFSDLVKLPDHNITTLWKILGLKENWIRNIYHPCSKYNRDKVCNYTYETFTTPTVLGTCLSIYIREPVRFYGPQTSVATVLDTPSIKSDMTAPYFFTMFLHDKEENMEVFDISSGTPLVFEKSSLIRIDMIKFERINIPTGRCTDSLQVQRCLSNCFQKTAKDKFTCKLPFMRSSNLSMCETAETVEASLSTFQTLLSQFNRTACGCPLKCKEIIYTVIVDTTIIPFINFIAVYFPGSAVTKIEEYRQLNLATMFANVFGSLGLFLDISALTLLELLQFLAIKMLKKLTCK